MRLGVVLTVCLASCSSPRHDARFSSHVVNTWQESPGWSKEQKLFALNSVAAAGVAVYGLGFWDYGGSQFNTIDEGWFGQDTQYGGADKLGHAFAGHVAATAFASTYESWGYDRDLANLYGGLSGFGTLALIEVGDAFSKNGFSYEDLVMDAVGVTFGYLRRKYRTLGSMLDFRVEYFPSKSVQHGEKTDLSTDYSGLKYLLALKLEGFEAVESSSLRYLELHLGYYTRGFALGDQRFYSSKDREIYVGIGFNVSRLFRESGLDGWGTLFNYYQVPYTYVPSNSKW